MSLILSLMRLLYTFLLYLCIPFLVLRLFWKARRLPAYKSRISERFCFSTTHLAKVDVWLHAVSLGEVNAASALIERLLAQNLKIIITTMTPTGSQQVQEQFGNRVHHQYLPYDLPLACKRFFKALTPKAGIIMETELWPNLINQAKRFNIPLVLANARISDKAFKSYYRLRFIFKPILNQLSSILAQSKNDAERFLALGAQTMKVSILGNLKFDINASTADFKAFQTFKLFWGEKRPVVIAASTHENEEALILEQLPYLQATIKNVLLIIAPRHPERFEYVYELSRKHNFLTCFKSVLQSPKKDIEVVILNTLGELRGFYSLADFAFVGGSLVEVGGHNVLEAIALQVPVFTGPFMQNCKAICNDLQAENAIQVVENARELSQKISYLFDNPHERQQQIQNAEAVLDQNRGSLDKHFRYIKRLLR